MPIACHMDFSAATLQFAGSLIAILALAGLAYWLKLGPPPELANEEDARTAADEAVSGFAPVAIGLDRDGRGAILRDAGGRVLLLRPHGGHFAGRILTPQARASSDGEALVIDTAEKRFGAARLVLDDPRAWVRAVEAIQE
mgnify:FL=1